MKISIEQLALISLSLVGSAVAAKGSMRPIVSVNWSSIVRSNSSGEETEVQACIYLPSDPVDAFTVDWSAGQSTDACMKRRGSSTSMKVTKQGVTCASFGDVEIDDDGWCYWQQSRWGMSYNVPNKPYSGGTSSRWTTGPVYSDINLVDASPGTVACGSPSLCSGGFKEWRNSNNEPIYIVFNLGKVAMDPLEL